MIVGAFLLAGATAPAAAGGLERQICVKQTGPGVIAACTVVIEDHSESDVVRAGAYNNRGYFEDAAGNGEAAMADYTAAIRLDPDNADPFENRAVLYANQGDTDHAIADYTAAIEIDGQRSTAFANRGLAWATKGEPDKALADFNEAIRLAPDVASFYYDRGYSYQDISDLDAAIADFSEAVRLDPKLSDAFVSRGLAYADKLDPDRAIADYDAALRLKPADANALFDRGNAWADKGDYARAVADYSATLAIDRRDAFALKSRGMMQVLLRHLPEAIADFSAATEILPSEPYTHLWLDIAQRRAGQASSLPDGWSQIAEDKWPAPIFAHLTGALSADELVAAAQDHDPVAEKGQLCEVNFYRGERALVTGSTEEGKALLQAALDTCPHDFDEYVGATAELQNLAASP